MDSRWEPGPERKAESSPSTGFLRAALAATAALGAIVGFGLADASAHATYRDRLARLDREIERDPRNLELHLVRASLHRERGDWRAALAALDHAAALAPGQSGLDLPRGQVLLDAGRPEQALDALSRYLRTAPDDPVARVARARALLALGRPLAAAEDYSVAIGHQQPPIPDHYLARARALAESAEPRLESALRGLDEGVRVFGSLASLELYAVELELRRGAHAAALARLDRITATSPRGAVWLVRRGEILEAASRGGEAQAAFERALAEIRGLPPHRRTTAAVERLEARARAGLERLSTNGDTP